MLPFFIGFRPGNKTGVEQQLKVRVQPNIGATAPSHPARCRVPVNPREGFEPMATSDNDNAHWKKTTRLMFMHLGLWLFFGYIVHMFVNVLNKVTVPILGFPLGFYMAAQGSLIAFVVMLFFFARQQDNIDREFGVAEDD